MSDLFDYAHNICLEHIYVFIYYELLKCYIYIYTHTQAITYFAKMISTRKLFIWSKDVNKCEHHEKCEMKVMFHALPKTSTCSGRKQHEEITAMVFLFCFLSANT